MSSNLLKKVHIKLVLYFIIIVVALQVIFALVFVLLEVFGNQMIISHMMLYSRIIMIEALFSIAVVALIGHYFIKMALKPAKEVLENLEEFTSDAAHELRTPITVTMSNLELAQKTKKYEEYVPKALNNLKQMCELVTRLLEITNISSLTINPSHVSVNSIFERVLETKEDLINAKKIKVNKSISSKPIKADEQLFYSLASNLTENALKFNKNKGYISISFNGGVLEVKNSTEKIVNTKNITERFKKQDSSGFGIGLSVVKRICDAHGWDLNITSKKDEFKVTVRTN